MERRRATAGSSGRVLECRELVNARRLHRLRGQRAHANPMFDAQGGATRVRLGHSALPLCGRGFEEMSEERGFRWPLGGSARRQWLRLSWHLPDAAEAAA